MAKAGRAGEGGRAPGGQGRRPGGGTRAARGGAPGSGEPLAQVGGGSGRAAAGGGEAGAPARAQGGSARLASFLRPRSPRGTPRPPRHGPTGKDQGCGVPAQPSCGSSHHPPAARGRPGTGTQGAVPRLPLHPTPPLPANQDAPPCPAARSIRDATIPPPSAQPGDPDFFLARRGALRRTR